MTAALKQQRNVQHCDRRPPTPASGQKPVSLPPDQRMQDSLQPRQRRWVTEHPGAERGAVDCAAGNDAREHRVDGRDRSTSGRHQPVDGGVGVVHRQSQPS